MSKNNWKSGINRIKTTEFNEMKNKEAELKKLEIAYRCVFRLQHQAQTAIKEFELQKAKAEMQLLQYKEDFGFDLNAEIDLKTGNPVEKK